MGMVHLSSHGKESISFDSLFPESPQKQLHDSFVQLWSDLMFLHDEEVSEAQKRDCSDLVMGQLVRIDHLLSCIKATGTDLYHDDSAYIQSIIESLSQAFGDFFSQKPADTLWRRITGAFTNSELS